MAREVIKETDEVCRIPGPCFGRSIKSGRCRVLDEIPEESCPFQKSSREETGGVLYPYNPRYGGKTI